MEGEVLKHVEGSIDKFNDVYLYKSSDEIDKILVFFPGDVQEVSTDMMQRRDTRWKEFCFENCAQWLNEKYKRCCVWIIKSSRMHLNTFACYDNFLETNEFGMPSYETTDIVAWNHLTSLIGNLYQKSFREEKYSASKELPIHLISFSKGCVVLNQLLNEMPMVVGSSRQDLLLNIKNICFLDNGVPGNSGAWLTKEHCIQLTAESFSHIELHTTPYQMKDKMRTWISREKKRFVQLLKKHNAAFTDLYYFENETPSLATHFELVKAFNPASI